VIAVAREGPGGLQSCRGGRPRVIDPGPARIFRGMAGGVQGNLETGALGGR